MKSYVTLFQAQKRYVATYGRLLLSHEDVLSKYQNEKVRCTTFAQFTSAVVPKLEDLEDHIGRWRLNKWLFRVPATLTSQAEKDDLMAQLSMLKEKWTEFVRRRESVRADVAVVTHSLGLSAATRDIFAVTSRDQIQGHITALRWNGSVDQARQVRAAWERLEKAGASDGYLLERMCCVYGLMRNNCFNGAFANIIKRDGPSGKVTFDSSDALRIAGEVILTNVPSMDLYFAFLGYNPRGYNGALAQYMALNLHAKHNKAYDRRVGRGGQGNIVLFESTSEFLYQAANTQRLLHVVSGGEGATLLATLVIVASPNRYEREGQIPKQKELDGISRRLGFVVGVIPDNVRVRVLFLPPNYVDEVSLSRLHETMGGLYAEEFTNFTGQYHRELSKEDKDFEHQRNTLPQEEWSAL